MSAGSSLYLLLVVFSLLYHKTYTKDDQCVDGTTLVGMLVPQQGSSCGEKCYMPMGLPCKCSCDTGPCPRDAQGTLLRTSKNLSPISCGMTCCAPDGMPTCTCKCGEGVGATVIPTQPTTPEPPKECRQIPSPAVGTYNQAECTSVPQQIGATCNLTCPDGYQKVGNMFSICLPTGVWSGIGKCLEDREVGDHLVHELAKLQDRNIVYVVDASGSVYWDYGTELRLVESIAQAFPLKTNDRYMGLITFDHEAWVRIALDEYVGHDETCNFVQAAHCAKFTGRSTDIEVALELAKDHINSFPPPIGDPANTIIVLLTDGNGGEPHEIAKEIKAEGTIIIAIGVGAYDEDVLQDVASGSTVGNKLFYGIERFEAFPDIIHEINNYGEKNGINCPKSSGC